jgi:hypothetical protein
MPSSKRVSDNREIADKEYERAISLMQYQTELLWQEFGAFLLAETVLIGFLGTALAQESTLIGKNWLIFGGAVLGLVLCLPWWSTFEHNYEYYRLRIAQARQHENILGIALLTEGKKLSSGQTVKVGNETFRHPLLARLLPPRLGVKFLIILFGIAFSMLIAITAPWSI